MRVASGVLLLMAWACGWAAEPQQHSADLQATQRLISEGNAVQAVESLRRIVAADPKDVEANLLLGTALALIPRRAEAIEVLRHAVELRPDSAQCHLILGNVLARFSETADARQAYEKALSLDPRLVMAHANLAAILAAERDLDPAAEHFTRAIELEGDSPDSARYRYLRGKVYREQNLPQKAAKDFEQAVQARPDYARAYLELGTTRADLHDESAALRALQKAVALAPDDGEARYQLGSAYLRAGDAQPAAEHLRAAARLRPDDRDVLYALARALRASGNSAEAEPLIERLSAAARDQAVHEADVLRAGELNNAGVALEKEGNFAAAMEKYRAALKISPREVRFRKNLALVLCRLERWQEAEVELREVLRAAPGDPDATKALYVALDRTHDSRH